MNVSFVEPFFVASHRQFTEGLIANSMHNITAITLPGRHWKWRMYGAAITLSKQIPQNTDLLICSDMLDVSTFKSLLPPSQRNLPLLLYFHENQLAYPWSKTDPDPVLRRDRHYAFTNYTSALAADQIAFNSSYNMDSFIDGLEGFLSAFPDFQNLDTIQEIKDKSQVLPVGLNLPELSNRSSEKDVPTILWNHRWEYDKNPEDFFHALIELKAEGVQFELIVIGQSHQKFPKIFSEAKVALEDRIIQWGEVPRTEYWNILQQADLLPVTSTQEFFGISVVEASHAGVFPLLPQRLTYPEHGYSVQHYYEGDVKNALSHLLSRWPLPHEAQAIAEKYRWDNIAPKFDDLLNKMVSIP